MQEIDTSKYLYILGLKPGASFDEIKEARSGWAKILHPDMHGDDEKKKEFAREKFAIMNDSVDQLKKWFEAHPDEKNTPKDQEKSDAGSAQQEQTEESQSTSGSEPGPMDWREWENSRRDEHRKQQSDSLESEIDYRKRMTKDQELKGRKNIAAWAKIVVGVLLVFMFIGQRTDNHSVIERRQAALAQEDQNYQYALSVPGAFGAVAKTREEIDSEHRANVVRIDGAGGGPDGFTQFLTIAGIAAFCWAIVAKRPKDRVRKWIEDGV